MTRGVIGDSNTNMKKEKLMSENNVSSLGRRPEGFRQSVRLSARQTAALDGDLSEWSDEELRRGYRRDRNGGWSGRPPKVVPKRLHEELVKRVTDQAAQEMRDNLVGAVRLYAQVFQDVDVPPATRLAAADRIVDRVLGKAPVSLDVTARVQPWEVVLDKIVYDDPEVIDHADVIDEAAPFTAAEVVEMRGRPRAVRPALPAAPAPHDPTQPRQPLTPPRRMNRKGVVAVEVDAKEFDSTPPAYDREGRKLAAEGRERERWGR